MAQALSLAGLLVFLQVWPGPQAKDSGQVMLDAGGMHPDAVLATGGQTAIAWTTSVPDGGSFHNLCKLSFFRHPEPGHAEVPHTTQDLFSTTGEVADCCVGRMAAAPTDVGRAVVVTGCSGRSGIWLWSQGTNAGRPVDLPAPVHPAPGLDQAAPRLVPATGGGAWLAWVEKERDHRDGGTVRIHRLGANGEPIGGPIDVSDPYQALATAGILNDGLSIHPLPDGGLAVAWLATGGDGDREIRFRLVDARGRPTIPEIVASPDDHEPTDSLRMHPARPGALALLWVRRGFDTDGGSEPDRIFFRLFSTEGNSLSGPLAVAADEGARSQRLPRIAASGSNRLLVWYEGPKHDPTPEEGWIALREWSPETGPIGLTTRFPAALAWRWPLLEAVPDETEGALTLYWHPNGPNGFADPGRLAWRRVVVPDAR